MGTLACKHLIVIIHKLKVFSVTNVLTLVIFKLRVLYVIIQKITSYCLAFSSSYNDAYILECRVFDIV
jgi:hypothetical protein